MPRINESVLVFATLLLVGCSNVKHDPPGERSNVENSAPRQTLIENSIGMKLARIPAGEFLMGSPVTEEGREAHETSHRVMITKPFCIGIYEVTQSQYQHVTGKNPSWFCVTGRGNKDMKDIVADGFPVESVGPIEVQEFCRLLSALPEEKAAGRRYRLPTEAEWEYACRAGTKTAMHYGDSPSRTQSNNYVARRFLDADDLRLALNRPTTVGSYEPNAWGLYDMHGNVAEWCQDAYGRDYETLPSKDPTVPVSPGDPQVVRGGSWNSLGIHCRSAYRGEFGTPYVVGFRVVCEIHGSP